MNPFLILILFILVGNYVIHLIVEVLNVNHVDQNLPDEFIGFYDQVKYQTSQKYLKENTLLDLVQSTVTTPVVVGFLLIGGFNYVDLWARSFGFQMIGTGLIFTGILVLGGQLMELPFSIYNTFVIEEKYGFNKTNAKTYITDLAKGWVLMTILGGALLSCIILFFDKTGELAWMYAWAFISLVQMILMFLAPVVLMPLFNKFTPLDDEEIKRPIETYAKSQNFKLKGIYTMDGSKRSTKSNAYFTGFGRFRRIVLFDTLIEKHTIDELVAILAHEMGHFKRKHIHKFTLISMVSTGLMLFVLSKFIYNENLFAAFRMDHISVYGSLVFFGFLYTPISMIITIFTNMLSRKFEFEADSYASQTFGKPESLTIALKKLSSDNLSNLTPHPLKVFLEYSHPPVLTRIRALQPSSS